MNEEILVALGRLEGKVDALITRQSLVDEELSRQEKRIRSLEQSKSYVIGAAAMVGAAVSLLVRFLKLEN